MATTLAERLGVKIVNNVTLQPYRGWISKQDQDYTIRELQCGKCHAVIAVEVTEHPASVDLVWPHKIICREDGHLLAPRTLGEDANMVCAGRGATKDEATSYLKKYLAEE